MPRSSRKPRPSVLNQLRGAGRGAAALQLARVMSARGFDEVIPWTVKNLRVAGPLATLRPRLVNALHSQPLLTALDIDIELRWTVEMLVSFASQINNALHLRSKVESSLVVGDGQASLTTLANIDETIGFSLSTIATRFAVLQLHGGLEAQKEEHSRLRKSSINANVKFFAYWWSVRSEEGSSWQNFVRDFERRLEIWDINEELRAHIAFQVLRKIPAAGEEQLLLSASYLGAAIDLYEAFIACASASVAEARPSAAMFAASCEALARHIEDGRLTKIMMLAAPNLSPAPISAAATIWRDFALSEELTVPAGVTGIGELFAASLPIITPDLRGTLGQRIRHAIGELNSPGGERRGLAELVKLGAMFDHLPLGQWIAQFSSHAKRIAPIPANVSRQLFCATPLVEPESLSWLEGQAYDDLTASLFGAKPIGAAWQWYRAQGGGSQAADIVGAMSLLARTEIEAFEAIRGGDFERLALIAERLEDHSGKISELSLLCRMQHSLNVFGLEDTLRLSVDYLLENPSLASWVPLGLLADEIATAHLPASNIDVPIILDFAARALGGEHSSARTYAAEDYILSQGTNTPIELTVTIAPADATVRQRYFLGEICVPVSLKTSTMFDKQRELEADRVGVCRWLIDADPKQAERFEEEARELVRSRHIRLGIQALQGSKLSIDSGNLRLWAERVVKEDFDRYMDLIEQGIFQIDDAFLASVYGALERGTETQKTLQIPDNEAAALFARFSNTMLREFALNPEHGLDAYLSLRIRHGTLSGHLRSPVEREHLITRKDAAGDYLENAHWLERLTEELDRSELQHLNNTLVSLSRGFDALIERITNDYIQIRRDEKPMGMISYAPSSTMTALMITDTSPDQSFDDFFVRTEDYFWVLVKANEERIDEQLQHISKEMGALFDQADEEIRATVKDGAGPLKDALLRAKTSALAAVGNIAEWLEPPTTQGSLVLSVEELVQVSLAVVTGFYPDFQPDVEYDIKDLPSLPGVVRLFSDIFFNIFENIFKYSGTPTDPKIRVAAWDGDDQIWFRVANSVETITPTDLGRIKMAKIRIADGSFRRLVRGEGGTGLPKLAKVIGYGAGGGNLSFDLKEDEKQFVVEFSLRKVMVAEMAEKRR